MIFLRSAVLAILAIFLILSCVNHSLLCAAWHTAPKLGATGECGMKRKMAENPGRLAAEPQPVYFTTVLAITKTSGNSAKKTANFA